MEEKGLDGEGWYKKVSGQSIAIEANIERFRHEVKVVHRTARARTTAIKRSAATTTKDVREVNRRDAGDFVSMLAREMRPGSVNSVLSGLSTVQPP
jgi:hypothetical protein